MSPELQTLVEILATLKRIDKRLEVVRFELEAARIGGAKDLYNERTIQQVMTELDEEVETLIPPE